MKGARRPSRDEAARQRGGMTRRTRSTLRAVPSESLDKNTRQNARQERVARASQVARQSLWRPGGTPHAHRSPDHGARSDRPRPHRLRPPVRRGDHPDRRRRVPCPAIARLDAGQPRTPRRSRRQDGRLPRAHARAERRCRNRALQALLCGLRRADRPRRAVHSLPADDERAAACAPRHPLRSRHSSADRRRFRTGGMARERPRTDGLGTDREPEASRLQRANARHLRRRRAALRPRGAGGGPPGAPWKRSAPVASIHR